jgi:hypothetical protein
MHRWEKSMTDPELEQLEHVEQELRSSFESQLSYQMARASMVKHLAAALGRDLAFSRDSNTIISACVSQDCLSCVTEKVVSFPSVIFSLKRVVEWQKRKRRTLEAHQKAGAV